MSENNAHASFAGVNPSRLFLGSCMSLISTSVAFGVVTSMMGELMSVFGLTATQAGWVGGATIWGFTISIFILGPFVDAIGMGLLMRFSLLCHIVGPLLMIFANGFGMLVTGGLILAMGNGTVEAVCNPLVATIYPDKKTEKLNQFHVWFPGGIVIGGLLAFAIGKLPESIWASLPLAAWQAKLALVFVPTVIYGIIFTGQKFPATERVQSGLSFGDMVKATFGRPLFIMLFICMGITASLELGPGRWMGVVMENAMATLAGAGAGVLVLVYGNVLMSVLRHFAGPVVERLSPTGILACSAILAGVGLLGLSFASGAIIVLATATVYYVGVCYFWPCMLGVTAERVPKGGSLALALMGGWGMAVVGIVTVPVMGMITDNYTHAKFDLEPTKVCIALGVEAIPTDKDDAAAAQKQVAGVSAAIASLGALPLKDTALAVRNIAQFAPDESEAKTVAAALIGPADEHGGNMSFRWVALLAIVIIVVFGALFLSDRAAGGYKAETLST